MLTDSPSAPTPITFTRLSLTIYAGVTPLPKSLSTNEHSLGGLRTHNGIHGDNPDHFEILLRYIYIHVYDADAIKTSDPM